MINFQRGKVVDIVENHRDIAFVKVEIDNRVYNAVNYNQLTGSINVGDDIKVNTTAVDLGLGTGGYHFIMDNLSNEKSSSTGEGHIMKLRYTPFQLKCYTAEENINNRDIFSDFNSLNGMPVIVATLHSMLAPIALMINKHKPNKKICYIMTDGGALPIAFSNTVRQLKSLNIIDSTITIGHAFGGDYEGVNIYSALIIAKEIAKCDVVIVSMGPGIVGTGTKFGFSGIEQGYIIDGVNTLGGTAISVPRISFQDTRERHKGISHHSITTLNLITKTKAILPIPILEGYKMDIIEKQIEDSKIQDKHKVIRRDGNEIIELLVNHSINSKTMGRGPLQDQEFFISLGAASIVALEHL